MDESPEVKPLIVAKLCYTCGSDKREKTSAQLFDDFLILSGPGFNRRIKLNTISGVSAADYHIDVTMPKGNVTLSQIGHLYEDFVRHFVRAYNEIIFKESLMSEAVHYETKGQYISPAGEISAAVFRICETALVILPETHALVRIPFCLVTAVKNEPYRFTISDKGGRQYVLQKLGFSTDNFLREYKQREAELVRLTKEKLSAIAPADDELALLMMEGLVTPITDIRGVSAAFADALERKLTEQMPEEYGYLKSVSEAMAVGIKRGLMGDLTGESIILLAQAGSRVIMESLGGSAAATYVFQMNQPWLSFLPAFNESMLAVNFRREPIYLSDEALLTGKYEAYHNALTRCQALVNLRTQYKGRVAHSGFEAWKRSLDAYLNNGG